MHTSLFTIGYEGADIRTFVTTLCGAGIEAIADVRAVAQSRKAGFSKRKLAEHLSAVGIDYRHFVDLGDPKPGRDAARAGQFDAFREIYGAHLASEEAQVSLSNLKVFAKIQPTCLLCFERDPLVCHRSMIGSAVLDSGFVVQNLFAGGPEVDDNYSNSLSRCHAGQSSAASQRQTW